MGKHCSPATWKCSLLIGSVLTWSLGVVVFGLSLSAIRKPVFMPSVVSSVAPVYHKLLVALAGSIFICLVAVIGCFGAACRKPCLLLTYVCGLGTLWIYQVVVAITLLYEKTETFPYIQFLSLDICQYRKQQLRGRQGRLLSQEDLIESITRAEANARLFNRNVAMLLEEQKIKGQSIDCSPVKDFLSPIASLLFISSALYVYFGYCTVRLAQHVWAQQRTGLIPHEIKYESNPESHELSPSLGDEFLESLFECEAQTEGTPNQRMSAFTAEARASLRDFGGVGNSSASLKREVQSVLGMSNNRPVEPVKIPRPEVRRTSIASPPALLTPRFLSTCSASPESFYFTPPASLTPAIILCPPTP